MGKRLCLLPLLLLLLFSAGCSGQSAAKLLELPGASDAQTSLTGLVNRCTREEGLTLLAPLSGDNTLPVSYVDFYGDGSPEALCYYADTAAGSLTVAVYTPVSSREYAPLLSFTLSGTAVRQAFYRDLDGDGGPELLLALSTDSTEVNRAVVYSLRNRQAACLFEGTCAALCPADLSGDGVADLFVFPCAGNAGAEAIGSLYGFTDGAARLLATVPVSAGARVESASEALLTRDCVCCYFESCVTLQGRTLWVTDVILSDGNGGLLNATYDADAGCAYASARSTELACRDVDFDGFPEYPQPEGEADPESGQCVNWYGIDGTGNILWNCCSYESADGDWYFLLPELWLSAGASKVSVERSVTDIGETYSFFVISNGRTNRMLTLYACAGEAPTLPEGAFLLVSGGGTDWYALNGEPDARTPLDSAFYLTGAAETRQRFVKVDALGGTLRAADAG